MSLIAFTVIDFRSWLDLGLIFIPSTLCLFNTNKRGKLHGKLLNYQECDMICTISVISSFQMSFKILPLIVSHAVGPLLTTMEDQGELVKENGKYSFLQKRTRKEKLCCIFLITVVSILVLTLLCLGLQGQKCCLIVIYIGQFIQRVR